MKLTVEYGGRSCPGLQGVDAETLGSLVFE